MSDYINNRVVSLLAQQTHRNISSINLYTRLGELGVSINTDKLGYDLEQEFGCQLQCFNYSNTVGDLIRHIERYHTRSGENANETENPEVTAYKIKLAYLFDNKEKLSADLQASKAFLRECDNLLKGLDNFMVASYRYLQALCCLVYFHENLLICDDFELKDSWRRYIKETRSLQPDDNEYKYMEAIYQRSTVDNNSMESWSTHNKISKNIESNPIENENTWGPKDYLLEAYQRITFWSLLESADYYNSNDAHWKALQINELIILLNLQITSMVAYANMASLYLRALEPKSKGYDYLQKVMELHDDTEDVDSDNYFDIKWIQAITNIGYCYQYGIGVSKNASQAFYYYSKAANYKDNLAMYNLGALYEYGFGVLKNINTATLWYKKSADLGFDLAIEKYEKLSGTKFSKKEVENNTNMKVLDVAESVLDSKTNGGTNYNEDNQNDSEELFQSISPIKAKSKEDLNHKYNPNIAESLLTNSFQLNDDEKDYHNQYQTYMKNYGEINAQNRRFLNKLKELYNISDARIQQIEKIK